MADFSVAIPWRADHGIRSKIFDWTVSRYRALFGDVEICLGDSLEEPFNRAASRNLAVAKSSHDIIVLADADTPPMPALTEAVRIVREGASWAYPYEWYHSLNEQQTGWVLASDPASPLSVPSGLGKCEFVMRSWAGAICISREAYNLVGGHDERFCSWGYEDTVFSVAATAILGAAERVSGPIHHLWHGRPLETTWEQPRITANKALCDEYERRSGNRQSMLEYVSSRR